MPKTVTTLLFVFLLWVFSTFFSTYSAYSLSTYSWGLTYSLYVFYAFSLRILSTYSPYSTYSLYYVFSLCILRILSTYSAYSLYEISQHVRLHQMSLHTHQSRSMWSQRKETCLVAQAAPQNLWQFSAVQRVVQVNFASKWGSINNRSTPKNRIEMACFPGFSEDKRTVWLHRADRFTLEFISQSKPKLMSCIAGVDAEVLATAQRESDAFGDLLLLDCEEGYGRGRVQMFAMRIGSKVVGGIWVKHILSVILILEATLPNLKLLSSDPMKRSHSIFLQASWWRKFLQRSKILCFKRGSPSSSWRQGLFID